MILSELKCGFLVELMNDVSYIIFREINPEGCRRSVDYEKLHCKIYFFGGLT